MELQFHACQKEKDLKKENMKTVQNKNAKPSGGFWTSTFNEETISDWIRWEKSEGYWSEGDVVTGYLLKPKSKARLYVIDSIEDCRKLLKDYGYILDFFKASYEKLVKAYGEDGAQMYYFIDYEKMMKEYDGLHLTRKGYLDCMEKAKPLGVFNGFDCESTIWLHWEFEEKHYKEFMIK
jgi:hypothetical protein